MKPQQRKFIVEVKSARRRSAIRPSSIWGDTDLKALVREAETEAPHLFGAVGRADNLSSRQNGEAGTQDQSKIADVPQIDSATVVAEEALPDRTEDAGRPLAEVAPVALEAPQMAKPNRRSPVVRRALSKTIDVPAADIAVDDLAALEEENRRLKGLLVQRLRQENAQLRTMLERFGTD
ncbi:hypothetical protein IB267_17885 [Ensifer sp. ENS09]|uniref:hypothetical protein n=1 Tax=Ensifer sp. ENS09 TaxID=2769263 RepID=UPI00178375A7|nr:hypothetical protein [Ensifer sp. ENS09]MBD9650222.1 hypothetical protein [Ensifer sp. ENS09]